MQGYPLLQPLGDAIDDAEGIVVARVVSIDDPRWNSEDGSDWRARFESDPTMDFTVPTVFTTVHLEVVDLLYERTGTGAPPLGSTLAVDFVGDPSLDMADPELQEEMSPLSRAGYLAEGDVRLFFLRWLPFPFPEGFGPATWRVDLDNGLWGVTQTGDAVFPTQEHHWSDVRKLIASGEVAAADVGGSTAGLTLDGFAAYVLDEAATSSEPVG